MTLLNARWWRRRNGKLWVAVLALTALIAAGCGSGGTQPTSTGGASAPASAPAPAGHSAQPAPTASSSGPTDLDALIAAAKKEKGLMLYGAPSEKQLRAYIDAFEQKYGLSGGEVLRSPTDVLISRVMAEHEANQTHADIFLLTEPQFPEQNPEVFQPMSPELVPILATYPQTAIKANFVQLSLSPATFVYNTNLVAESDVPKTWDQILNPKFKGRFLLTNPRQSQNYANWTDNMGKLYGMEFLTKLKDQGFNLIESGATGAQQVAAGAYMVNTPSFPSFTLALPKEAPVRYVIPEPVLVSEIAVTILAKAPNPNRARLFTHWLLSEEGIRVTCQFGTGSPADLEGKLGCVRLGSNYTSIAYATPPGRLEEVSQALDLK